MKSTPNTLSTLKRIIENIRTIYPLPDASLQQLTDMLREVDIPKGQLLLKEGRTANRIFFIERGMVRGYAHFEEKEVTICFGAEGDVVFSFNGYFNHSPGYENFVAVEDVLLYQLDATELQQRYNTDIALANWGRKLAEQALVQMEERFISRQVKPASIRYQELVRRMPHLLQRVQLSHLASFLGVTQVSLSRIRAGKQ